MAKSRKDGGQINWIAVKSYYITHNVSLEKTAEKFGVSLDSVKRHSKAENWVAAKKKKQEEIQLRVIQNDTEKQVDILSRIEIAADKMLEHIERTICDRDQFNRHIIIASSPAPEGIGVITTQYEEKFDKRDTKCMKDVVAMIKDIKAMSGGQTQTELMKQQLERERFEFEKEKFEWEKAQAEKKAEADKIDNDIRIQVSGFEDAWTK